LSGEEADFQRRLLGRYTVKAGLYLINGGDGVHRRSDDGELSFGGLAGVPEGPQVPYRHASNMPESDATNISGCGLHTRNPKIRQFTSHYPSELGGIFE
jgi:hypothetical protein